MRVVVIGAGAIGGLYGGLLARAGHEVAFLARGAHLAAIRQRGLEVRSAQFGTFTVHGLASDDAATLGTADLALMAVKTYDLGAASEAAKCVLGPGSKVLTFQNGVEAPDQVAAVVGRERVLIGTTSLETTIAEPGVVAHLSPFHRVTVGELEGPPTPRVEAVVATFRETGIEASVAPDGRRALWEKACFLIPLAAMTTVCQSAIGPILALPETSRLMDEVFAEVAAVAKACGYDVAEASKAARASTRQIAPTMKASMARDFERGGRNELEALGGAIVRLAALHEVPVPANRAIYAILKLRSQQASQAS